MTTQYEFFDPGEDTTFVLRDGHPQVQQGYKQLLRYAHEGIARRGQVVRLRVCRTPHALATTLSEYRRFISRVNALEIQSPSSAADQAGRTPAKTKATRTPSPPPA